MTAEVLTLERSPIVTVGYFFQVILSLAIVLAIIYVAARFLLPRLKIAGAGKLIQVIDRAFLEPQVTAYIIKVGKSAWLLVSSNKQVTKIDKLEEEI